MQRRDFLYASSILAGAVVPSLLRAQTRPCPPSRLDVEGGQGASTACVQGDAEADWQARISGAGVVWFHDFRADDEVNNFRWTPGYRGGNDPLAVGSANAKFVRRITTDGVTGGGCMEIVRPAGSQDGSVWWRPFSPIRGGTASGNGRGFGNDDPGANRTLPVQSYAATDGGSQISSWGDRGFYGTSGPGPFDGTDYYLQVRVKMDPNRIAGGNGSIDVGKLFYFTRHDRSATAQEIVVFSGHSLSQQNYFSMYRTVGPPLAGDPPGVGGHGDQPGTQFGSVGDKICRFDNSDGRLANCWHWPAGQWATVMWHIRNGSNGGNDTLVEVWVAGPGQKQYTKIWQQPGVDLPFDAGPAGHNALICSIYHNGTSMPTQFYHRYDQIIFSKQMIPCPQV
jgi:hypothetical protein